MVADIFSFCDMEQSKKEVVVVVECRGKDASRFWSIDSAHG